MKKGELVIVSLVKASKTMPERTKIEKKSTGEIVTIPVKDDIFHDAIELLGEEKVFAYYKEGKNFCLVIDERADLEKLSGKDNAYLYTRKNNQ